MFLDLVGIWYHSGLSVFFCLDSIVQSLHYPYITIHQCRLDMSYPKGRDSVNPISRHETQGFSNTN